MEIIKNMLIGLGLLTCYLLVAMSLFMPSIACAQGGFTLYTGLGFLPGVCYTCYIIGAAYINRVI